MSAAADRLGLHEVAASWDGERVAGALRDGLVGIWSLRDGACVAAFETVWSAGGSRLAISRDGAFVCAAGWEAGVGGYEAGSGARLWHRRERRVQGVAMTHADDRILVHRDTGPGRVLDRRDGRRRADVRAARGFWVSPFAPLWLVQEGRDRGAVRDFDGRLVMRMRAETFSILAAAFAPGLIATSDVGGAVRVFALDDGRERCRFTPQAGRHALDIAWDDARSDFVVALYAYESRDAAAAMVRIDPATGRADGSIELPREPYRLCRRGSRAVARHGGVVDTRDGSAVLQLDLAAALQ
jgi:hypothetical protein